MMTSAAQIGLNEKTIRKRRGISVAFAAKYLGITDTALYKWEDGTRDIPVEYISELAALYHVSSDYLLNFHEYNLKKEETRREWNLISMICDYFMRHNSEKHRKTMHIILYIINEWDGDFDALVNMSGAYASLPPEVRKDVSGLCLHTYRTEASANRVDRDLSEYVDIDALDKQWETLDRKTDKEFFKHLKMREKFKEDYGN